MLNVYRLVPFRENIFSIPSRREEKKVLFRPAVKNDVNRPVTSLKSFIPSRTVAKQTRHCALLTTCPALPGGAWQCKLF